jgi:hypothetical protein
LAFLFLSLLRGAITGWYPYPFLNPSQPGGWLAVGVVSGIILLLGCGMIWVILKLVPKGSV